MTGTVLALVLLAAYVWVTVDGWRHPPRHRTPTPRPPRPVWTVPVGLPAWLDDEPAPGCVTYQIGRGSGESTCSDAVGAQLSLPSSPGPDPFGDVAPFTDPPPLYDGLERITPEPGAIRIRIGAA